MQYAVCKVPAAPVYAGASHSVEMSNQLLYGEPVEIITATDKLWIEICSIADGYEGWVTRLQLSFTDIRPALPTGVITELLSKVHVNEEIMLVPFGSYTSSTATQIIPGADLIRNYAMMFLNAPYLWGGRTILGIDCSGFTQIVCRASGISILRDAWQQATQGTTVDFLQEAKTGDLAFFDNEEGRIIHTGIVLNENQIIHAAGKVRIDKLDSHGIVNKETGERTHRLRIIKRYY